MTNGARIKLNRLPNYYAERYAQPDVAAGQAFAKALGLPASAVSKGTAPAGSGPEADPSAGPGPTASADPTVAGAELGRVQSPPMLRLVEFMLVESDNVVAEALARQVAIAKGEPASFVGAAAAMKAVLAELGLPADRRRPGRRQRAVPDQPAHSRAADRPARDGRRRQQPGAVADLRRPAGGRLVRHADRAVQGHRGAAAGVGAIRAKTGTLNGVSAIVGHRDDRRRAAAGLRDAGRPGAGRPGRRAGGVDRIAGALAGCGCR